MKIKGIRTLFSLFLAFSLAFDPRIAAAGRNEPALRPPETFSNQAVVPMLALFYLAYDVHLRSEIFRWAALYGHAAITGGLMLAATTFFSGGNRDRGRKRSTLARSRHRQRSAGLDRDTEQQLETSMRKGSKDAIIPLASLYRSQGHPPLRSVSETLEITDRQQKISLFYRKERNILKAALEAVHDLDPKRVLIIGSGISYLAPSLKPMGIEVVLNNPSQLMPDLIEKENVIKESFDSLGFFAYWQSFDMILLPDVAGDELGGDCEQAIRNLYHFIKPGGHLLMPHRIWIENRWVFLKNEFLRHYPKTLTPLPYKSLVGRNGGVNPIYTVSKETRHDDSRPSGRWSKLFDLFRRSPINGLWNGRRAPALQKYSEISA